MFTSAMTPAILGDVAAGDVCITIEESAWLLYLRLCLELWLICHVGEILRVVIIWICVIVVAPIPIIPIIAACPD